eukprot:8068226-Pyramimonas_sp.AAC.1
MFLSPSGCPVDGDEDPPADVLVDDVDGDASGLLAPFELNIRQGARRGRQNCVLEELYASMPAAEPATAI